MPRLIRTTTFTALVVLLAACAGGGGTSSGSGTATTDGSCAAEDLDTVADGRLTIGTSNPAYPPYFDFADEAAGEEPTDPWELGDPTNGRGFESAVAYAVAEELGFAAEEVDWTVVPFENSFAPGEKDFDFTLQQISYTDERAEVVDMSDGYFFVNQALVSREGSDLAEATTLEDVKQFRLGVAAGTTSLAHIEEVIQPEADPSVYNDNDAAIAALNAEQIDGIVVDLPTAFFITAAQMEDGVIVGQFPPADDEQERFSVVLEKDSPLTECVNQAIAALTESGDLEAITDEWMSENAGAPEITP